MPKSEIHKVKSILKRWFFLAIIISVFVVGLLTSSRYQTVDIQLHDTYFVVNPFDAIVKLTGFFFMIPITFLLAELLSSRYKILALLISIINPLIALFVVIFLNMTISVWRTVPFEQAAARLEGHILTLTLLTGILILQVVIQISAMRKLTKLIG